MRTGRYEVQQSLTAEAANVLRQAVGLARRRGNVQVTPLHVASAMLSVAGLLRAACLQSQSNQLQCKALELGFSVALSRLPMAARPAVAMFHHGPALSNALVAALKRAQSRQRRCSEDGPRQPAAPAAKVELEQLVISILDDPNVGRVMHEAGFSSSLVRANVEKAISLEQSNRESSKSTSPNPIYTKCSRAEPCLEAAIKVPGGSRALSLGCGSELQASQARSGWPTTFVGAAAGDREMTSCGTSLQATCCRQKFTDLTAENLKILCNALELRVPRHKDIVPDIATTVLLCRAGMPTRVRRRERLTSSTWLLFQGRDTGGKKAMAQELAKLVFGSYTEFTSITMAEFTPVNSDSSSSGKLTLKRQRSRDNENGYVGKRLFEAILENPHRVFLINGIDQLDHDSEISIQNAIANERMRGSNGDVVSLDDAIIALSCEAIDSWSFASSPPVKQRISRKNGEEKEDGMEKEGKSRFSLDLNACVEDGEEEEENSIYDVGLLNDVDGVFLFR